MKKFLIFSAAMLAGTTYLSAQNTFPATGNVGIGTLSPASSLQVIGTTRLGSATNYLAVDANGNLSFTGTTAAYKVAGNKYAFQFSGNPNFGLYFNQASLRYEFRNSTAAPNLNISAAGPDLTLPIASGNLDSNSTFKFVNSNAGVNDWQFEHYRNTSIGDNGSLYISHSSSDFSTPETIAALFDSSAYKFWVYGNMVAVGYFIFSDQKLKRDINDVKSAMSLVSQLKPKTYYFNSDKYNALGLGKNMRYGFLAQDVEQVMPELVGTSTKPVRIDSKGIKQYEEVKSVNYVELIPLLTKAIQELQAEVEDLKANVASLKSASASQESSITISGASLGQNVPNPLTKSSTIRYNVPSAASSAQLLITDMNGKTMKQISLSKGQGTINVDASSFAGGTYNYSLIVNGRNVDTKRMVVAE